MSRKKFKFSENEKVLCYQGPLIYEAKCLLSEVRENEKHFYFVHYSGWNKHWDEWVSENRVLKYNETNLNKQKELLKRFGAEKNKRIKVIKSVKNEKEVEKRKISEVISSNVEEPLPNSTSNLEPEKKKVCLKTVEEDVMIDFPITSHIVKVVIPPELKEMLVDDWDLVSRQKQLFSLPAKISVHKILKKYTDEVSVMSNNLCNPKEIIFGLQEYFNVTLGSHLLYKFERPQYGELLTKYPHLTASQLYGAFHFLRFFVKLDSVLSNEGYLSEKNVKLIAFYVHDCLQFLRRNISKFFNPNEYVTAPAEYHRRAMT